MRNLWILALSGAIAGCNNDKPGASPPPQPSPPATSVSTVTAPPVASPIASAAPSATPPAPISSAALPPINTPATVTEKRPYVVFLHGLGASGKILTDNLGIASLAAEHKFSWSAPDGDLSSKKQRFWNASKACCNLDGTQVDHVARFRSLIAAAATNPKIDSKRIYVVGWSNGGFMAHRLACEVAGIAGIVSIAGAGPAEGEACTPPGPVAVLQIHGDADDTIKYAGGNALGRTTLPRHPSALETVEGWAARDGCKGKPVGAGTLDLDDKLDGAETAILRFPGCTRPVELWTVHGGGHMIGMGHRAQELFVGFLEKTSLP
ncbi:MAG: dienelactone hydrolase family protein [Deltaproteobacteria bacterium]|nr:dienelactone hydrolase family protein [Deltaproteobacteria bacterium]